ncbi:MAG TPA: type II toxin-antitoxin system RelE/ParE family toxin [Xanthobacteraceae bacterium]|jgi:phage-related protein
MAAWTIELLDAAVSAELDAWPTELRAALTRITDRITTLGLERIGEPHVRHIEGKLWEMRASGGRLEGRALYVAATGRRVVIVLAFVKKTRKTPDRLIRLALERARRIKP